MSECREVAEALLPRFVEAHPGEHRYAVVEAFVASQMKDESYTVRDNVTYFLHRLAVVAVEADPRFESLYEVRKTYRS